MGSSSGLERLVYVSIGSLVISTSTPTTPNTNVKLLYILANTFSDVKCNVSSTATHLSDQWIYYASNITRITRVYDKKTR